MDPADPRPPAVRAVVFDLDDTLYPERQYVRSGYQAVAAELRRRTGRGEDFGGWLWERFRRGEHANAFDALGERFGLGLDRGRIARLVRVYREHRPDIRARPGVARLLDRLGERVKLGLLTDGYLPAQRLKLEALGLGERFDAVVFTEQLGRSAWKPSPAGFERIRELLDVPHAACCYVADNCAKDFVAPNALGWRTVLLRCDGQVHAARPAPPGGEPRRTIHALDELPAVL